jgi:hypothetical protein
MARRGFAHPFARVPLAALSIHARKAVRAGSSAAPSAHATRCNAPGSSADRRYSGQADKFGRAHARGIKHLIIAPQSVGLSCHARGHPAGVTPASLSASRQASHGTRALMRMAGLSSRGTHAQNGKAGGSTTAPRVGLYRPSASQTWAALDVIAFAVAKRILRASSQPAKSTGRAHTPLACCARRPHSGGNCGKRRYHWLSAAGAMTVRARSSAPFQQDQLQSGCADASSGRKRPTLRSPSPCTPPYQVDGQQHRFSRRRWSVSSVNCGPGPGTCQGLQACAIVRQEPSCATARKVSGNHTDQERLTRGLRFAR